MAKRLAKNVITASEETAASTNFSFCMARLTQALARVEGKKTENLQSEDKSQGLSVQIIGVNGIPTGHVSSMCCNVFLQYFHCYLRCFVIWCFLTKQNFPKCCICVVKNFFCVLGAQGNCNLRINATMRKPLKVRA